MDDAQGIVILGKETPRLRRTKVTFFPSWNSDRKGTDGLMVVAHQARWDIYRAIHIELS